MNKTYPNILRAASATHWAIDPRKIEEIQGFFELVSMGGGMPDQLWSEHYAAQQAARAPRSAQNVAVIPIYGTISYRANMLSDFSGGTSVQGLTKALRAALNDPTVKAIVFDVDSPGGAVNGVQEFADEIFAARDQKKIIAVANTLAASAAYMITSAATEVVVVPSGEVGAIGVFTIHMDSTQAAEKMGVKPTLIYAGKYKMDGHPLNAMTEEMQGRIQARVNDYYDTFIKAVARGRGVTAADVRNGFGEGSVVGAKEAKSLNMVDRIDTLDGVLQRLGVSADAQQSARAESDAALIAETFSVAPDQAALVESQITTTAKAALDQMRRELDLAAH